MNKLLHGLSLAFALSLVLSISLFPTDAIGELKVGFAEVDITPTLEDEDRPVWIAGYGHGRRATAVHDPIMARCAVLSDGTKTFAIVGADLVGLQLPQIDEIREKLDGIDHFVLSSSHNHEGPDVIGIWGRTPIKRGVDDAYLAEITTKIASMISVAQKKLAPAEAAFGTADEEALLVDSRLPEVYDPTLRALRFTPPGKEKPAGIIVQWNCHPEAMGPKNTELTADFPATTVATLKEKHGCPIVYVTGAVGGLMAPPDGHISDEKGKVLEEGDWEYARLLGIAVAGLANEAIATAEPIVLTPFKFHCRDVFLPVRNPYYRGAFTAGVLQRGSYVDTGDPAVKGKPFKVTDSFKKMAIRTEINVLRLGDLDIAGIPGELYPELVYGKFQEPADPNADFPDAPLEKTVDSILAGRKWMLLGLANDEVGYIIPKRQWDNDKPYAYGREKSQYGEMNSCSPDVAPILMEALAESVAALTEEKKTNRILSYNVWYGFTKKPERKATWLKWMDEQKPDIVALQELNGYTPEQLKKDAAAWGHKYSALLKEEGFPTGLTSRTPITEIQRTLDGYHHGLLRCRTGGYIVYVIHFHPSNWEHRIREAELLLADVAKLPAADRERVVFIGDFNGFSPLEKDHLEKGDELAKFFGRLDEAGGRQKNLNAGKLDYGGIQAFHDAGYSDLIHAHLEKRAPYPGTFPTGLRPDEDMGRDRRLDYVFVPESLAGRVSSAKVVRDKTTALLSDHYPVVMDIREKE